MSWYEIIKKYAQEKDTSLYYGYYALLAEFPARSGQIKIIKASSDKNYILNMLRIHKRVRPNLSYEVITLNKNHKSIIEKYIAEINESKTLALEEDKRMTNLDEKIKKNIRKKSDREDAFYQDSYLNIGHSIGDEKNSKFYLWLYSKKKGFLFINEQEAGDHSKWTDYWDCQENGDTILFTGRVDLERQVASMADGDFCKNCSRMMKHSGMILCEEAKEKAEREIRKNFGSGIRLFYY